MQVQPREAGADEDRGQTARDEGHTDEQADEILASPQGQQFARMMHYTTAGTPDAVARYLEQFASHADADEIITCHAAPTLEGRLRSIELVAEVAGLTAAA